MALTKAYPRHKHNDFKRDFRDPSAMSSSVLAMTYSMADMMRTPSKGAMAMIICMAVMAMMF